MRQKDHNQGRTHEHNLLRQSTPHRLKRKESIIRFQHTVTGWCRVGKCCCGVGVGVGGGVGGVGGGGRVGGGGVGGGGWWW